MNNIFHSLLMRRRSKRVLESGLGPFTSDCLIAFSQCRCQQCAKPISENSLLGNALVAQKECILVLCSACRTGKECVLYPKHPFRSLPRSAEDNNTIDRAIIIGEMDWLISNGDLGFSFHDFLLCLRSGYGLFQKYSRKPFSGYSAKILQDAKSSFGRPLPGSCGECGALWANVWEMSQKNKDEILRGRHYSMSNCWACGFPHSDQWFMRISFAEESQLLGGRYISNALDALQRANDASRT